VRAILIAVGSEFLTQDRRETNTTHICRRLLEYGILTEARFILGDDRENLVWILKKAVKKSQWLIITGGLGPTEDDLTRESLADALQRKLVYREDVEEQIFERLGRFRRKISDNNKRQAFVIEGAEVIDNPNGSAPGMFIPHRPCQILLLPGPPGEMIPMFERVLRDRIAPRCRFSIYSKTLKFVDIPESELDMRISERVQSSRRVDTTILSRPGLIEVQLLGRTREDPDEMRRETDDLADRIREELKEFFITDQDVSLAQHVVEALVRRGLSLGVAESCTGGGLGKRLTGVPGSSQTFAGGVIAYSDEVKRHLLGVSEETLQKKGAVSPECAREMAGGVKKLLGTDLGISVTGIAGPAGATAGKPVGLVFMHLSAADEEVGIHRVFPGDRKKVRERSINTLLGMIHRHLSGR